MQVFSLSSSSEKKVQASVAVDPGICTLGACLFFHDTGEMSTGGWEGRKLSPTRKSLPELQYISRSLSVQLLRRIEKRLGRNVDDSIELIVEYPFMRGSFVAGLSVFITSLVDVFFYQRRCNRVLFVPARIPEFFLTKRGVSDEETVEFVQRLFPNINMSVHCSDAVLFLLLCNYSLMKERIVGKVREPQYEVVDLRGKLEHLLKE